MILHATLVLALSATGTAGDTSNVSLMTFRLPKVLPFRKTEPTDGEKARARLVKIEDAIRTLEKNIDSLEKAHGPQIEPFPPGANPTKEEIARRNKEAIAQQLLSAEIQQSRQLLGALRRERDRLRRILEG